MIDAIDSLLDKLDLFMTYMDKGMMWFLIFAGVAVLMMSISIFFIFNSLSKVRKSQQLQKEEIVLLKQLLVEQQQLNRALRGRANGPDDSDSGDGDTPGVNLRDLY